MTRASGLKEFVQVFNCACDAWTHHKTIGNLEHACYIQQNLENNPLTGKWFVFFNKKHDKIKIFYWDGNGPCFWYKRLEQGVFRPPRIQDKVYTVNSHELNLLLEGIDLTNKQRFGIVPVSTVN